MKPANNRRQRDRSKNKRTDLAINFMTFSIAAALALLAFEMWRARKSPREQIPAAQAPESIVIEKAAEADPSGKALDVQASSRAQPKSEEIRLNQEVYLAHAAMGFASMPFPQDEGASRKLRVRIQAEARCGVGDYEAIEADLQRTGTSSLLVTLESAQDDGQAVVLDSKEVSFNALQSGISLNLNVPVGPRIQMAGVYVCSSSGAKDCSSKKATGIETLLLARYQSPEQEQRAIVSSDPKLYYVNYLEIDQRGVSFNSTGDVRSDDFNAQFTSHTSKLGGSKVIGRQLDDARTLYSVPLRAEEGTLRINLPRGDDSLCTRDSRQP